MAVFAIGAAAVVYFSTRPTIPSTLAVSVNGTAVDVDARRAGRNSDRGLEYSFDFNDDGRAEVTGTDAVGAPRLRPRRHVHASRRGEGPPAGGRTRPSSRRSRSSDGRPRLDHAASALRRAAGHAGPARRGVDSPRPGLRDRAGDVPGLAAAAERVRLRAGRLPDGGRQALDRAAGRALSPGRRRHLAVAGAADDVPDAADAGLPAGDRHPQRPRPRVHGGDADPGDRDDRRVSRASTCSSSTCSGR